MTAYNVWIELRDGSEKEFNVLLDSHDMDLLCQQLHYDERVRDFAVDAVVTENIDAVRPQLEHFLDNFDGGQP